MSWCWLVIPLVLVALVTGGGGTPLGCRDQNGTDVDWYVLINLPSHLTSDGTDYVYVSSRSAGAWWTMSDVSINNPLSAPGRTLQPIYDDPQRDSLVYAFYNDAWPDGTTNGVKGHTKGVVAFDGDRGFWMVHSVPMFPPPPGDGYSFPESGQTYGQSFLCVTLSSSQLETVAQQLLYMEPFIYASWMPSSLKSRYPEMARVIAGERHSGGESSRSSYLVTPRGRSFLSFAKSRDFGQDLYTGLVAPTLQASLNTETWMRTARRETRLPDNGEGREGNFTVHNVREVSISAMRPSRGIVMPIVTFDNIVDHSKWAVSRDRNNPWVCIGDINRTTTQFRRGGGTVCFHDDNLWQIFFRMARVEGHGIHQGILYRMHLGNSCFWEACMRQMSTTTTDTPDREL